MANATDTKNPTDDPTSANSPAFGESQVVILQALKRAIDIVILSNLGGPTLLVPRSGQHHRVGQTLRVVVDTNDTTKTYSLAVIETFPPFPRVWPSPNTTYPFTPDDDGFYSGRPVPANTLVANKVYAVEVFVNGVIVSSVSFTAKP